MTSLAAQASSLSGSAKKPKKKKPAEGGTKPLANSTKCKIKIYHQEDHSLRHIHEHPINKAIQRINYIIRLIFKARDGAQAKDGPPTTNYESLKGGPGNSSQLKNAPGDSQGF